MLGAVISFAAMAVSVRELSGTMQSAEIMFFRGLVGLAIVIPLVARRGWSLVATRRFGLHAVRNVIHFGAQFGWVYAIALLPLAEVTAIEFTTPIWVAVFAVAFLGEKMTRGKVVAVALGFLGIVVILRPGLEGVQLASLIVLGSAFGYAITHIFTKTLAETDAPLTIIFYMTAIQMPLAAVPALFQWTQPEWVDAPWLLVLGGSALTAHYCLARAFRLVDATVAVPIDFLRLPLVAAIGYLFYAEGLEVAVLVGAVMIFAGNYYNIVRESRGGR